MSFEGAIKALPLNKLIETIKCGVGTLYEPIHIKKLADARAYEIRKIADAKNEMADLAVNYDSKVVCMPAEEPKVLEERAEYSDKYIKRKKQKNIEDVIIKAYNELEVEENISEEKVDEDWSTRFFSIVGDISNEQMKIIWGKILAGEIKSPNSYSLRTLEVLKNLTKNEAEIFQRIFGNLINLSGSWALIDHYEFNSKYNLSLTEILILCDAGLLAETYLSYSCKLDNNKRMTIPFKDYALLLSLNYQGTINLPVSCKKLTVAGEQIFKLINKATDLNYIKDVKNYFLTKNIQAECHKIKCFHQNGQFEYFTEVVEL